MGWPLDDFHVGKGSHLPHLVLFAVVMRVAGSLGLTKVVLTPPQLTTSAVSFFPTTVQLEVGSCPLAALPMWQSVLNVVAVLAAVTRLFLYLHLNCGRRSSTGHAVMFCASQDPSRMGPPV